MVFTGSAGLIQAFGVSGQVVAEHTLDQIEVEITVEAGCGDDHARYHHLAADGPRCDVSSRLDRTEHDPLCIYANNTLVGRGEIKVEDGQLSVEVTEKVLKLG